MFWVQRAQSRETAEQKSCPHGASIPEGREIVNKANSSSEGGRFMEKKTATRKKECRGWGEVAILNKQALRRPNSLKEILSKDWKKTALNCGAEEHSGQREQSVQGTGGRDVTNVLEGSGGGEPEGWKLEGADLGGFQQARRHEKELRLSLRLMGAPGGCKAGVETGLT